MINIIMFVSATFTATAQSGYDALLQQIETNSTTLSVLRQQMEVQQLGNRTGVYLANPEVEFNYLWGSPSAVGNRIDFTVVQSFDFPTAYVHRNKMAALQNKNVELEYKAERIKLLLSAKQICIELIYNNALAKEYAVRLQNAERIAATYKSRMSKGDANVIENNKAQLNLSTVQNEMTRIEAERMALLAQLKSLNGGLEIVFPDNEYPVDMLPSDFEEWYAIAEAKSPMLQYVSGQIEIGQRQLKLSRALNLPKFSAGYTGEHLVSEQFRGITVGMSVPLWENKNTLKQAKTQLRANELALTDSRLQFYNHLRMLYAKAVALQQNAMQIKRSLSEYNNVSLLQRALDAGEISLLNYLLEVEYYYDAINKALEAERNYQLTVA
ncbi:MAG: TolC family protein, partial [Bacteroidales bacterium]|nr:TolC family protein [Bacteroidales bacterium]